MLPDLREDLQPHGGFDRYSAHRSPILLFISKPMGKDPMIRNFAASSQQDQAGRQLEISDYATMYTRLA